MLHTVDSGLTFGWWRTQPPGLMSVKHALQAATPAEKWLKDRRRRTLSYEDITHYRRICAILADTPRVMAQIDETVDAYGGSLG